MAFSIATTAWLVAPRALPPPSTRGSAARARPAAARHRVPGASPVSGVLDLGAASSTGRAHVPRPFFPGCPLVLVQCSHTCTGYFFAFFLLLSSNESTWWHI